MPTIVDGTTLVPPRRDGDCACTFCGIVRARHYWRRAVISTLAVPALIALTLYVRTQLQDLKTPGSQVDGITAVMMIVITGAVVLAIACWYQPMRRLLHMRRPRGQSLAGSGFASLV